MDNEDTAWQRSIDLRIGTDCSGMEAPIQAIKNIGIK